MEKESGFQLENHWVSSLRSFVIAGDWSGAENAISSLRSTASNDGNDDNTMDRSNDSYLKLLYLIRRQKYCEQLLHRQRKEALHTLRSEITGLPIDGLDVQELASWIIESTPELIPAIGTLPEMQSRRLALYDQMQAYIPRIHVLPRRRLENLLEQAVNYQISSCLYHNTFNTSEEEDTGLYIDHRCDRELFPRSTTHVFEAHTDEVWFVAFSHDGIRLASASKDQTCIIWSVEDWSAVHVLSGHEDAVSFLAWSPNNSHILSCGNDHKIKLWDTSSGACQRTFNRHTDAVTSCAWLPDGKRFVSSSLDKTIYFWNVDGTLLYRWIGARVTDLAINSRGTHMIAVCHERKIRIYNIEQKSEDYIQEEHSITSLSLSLDSRYALVNISAEVRVFY